jgi:hypothetical protein
MFFPLLFLLASSTAVVSEENTAKPEAIVDIQQGHEIVRALIQNPELAQQLNQEHLHQVGRMTREELEPGITRYVLKVSTCGNCMPKRGTVEIIEDMRPTYNDGPVRYEFSVSVDD